MNHLTVYIIKFYEYPVPVSFQQIRLLKYVGGSIKLVQNIGFDK